MLCRDLDRLADLVLSREILDLQRPMTDVGLLSESVGVTQDRDLHGTDLDFPPCVLSSVSLDTLDADPQMTLDHRAVSGWYVREACCSCERCSCFAGKCGILNPWVAAVTG